MTSAPSATTTEQSIAPPVPLKHHDLERFRRPSDLATESIKLPVPATVRSPIKTEWFRTHPDDTVWFACSVYLDEAEMSRTIYIVVPSIIPYMGSTAVEVTLVPCLNLAGELFFWPLKNSANSWSDSARGIAADARSEWRRMEASMTQRAYQAYKPGTPPASPSWPDESTIQEQMLRAFGNRVIDSESHPIVAKLRLA